MNKQFLSKTLSIVLVFAVVFSNFSVLLVLAEDDSDNIVSEPTTTTTTAEFDTTTIEPTTTTTTEPTTTTTTELTTTTTTPIDESTPTTTIEPTTTTTTTTTEPTTTTNESTTTSTTTTTEPATVPSDTEPITTIEISEIEPSPVVGESIVAENSAPSENIEPETPVLKVEEKEYEYLEDGVEVVDTVDEDWELNEEGFYETKEKVKIGIKYVFPENEKVTVTFKKLPASDDDRSTLRMKEVNPEDLPEELQDSNVYAVDITTDMVDGDFEYDLTLPKAKKSKAEVSYMEDLDSEIKSVEEDNASVSQEEDSDLVEIGDLDHMTVFVVVTDDNATYSGTWIDYPTQGYNDNGVHYPTTLSASQTATWKFTTITAGSYNVYVSWSTHSNRTQNAPYTLTYSGGTKTFTVNQELLADQSTSGGDGQWSGWYKIGTFDLTNTSNLILSSVDNSSDPDYVIADEVLLVPDTAPETVWVDDNYKINSRNDGHVWGYDAFNNIQNGVNAVASTGTVHVASGTYNETINIKNKSLSLEGVEENSPTILGGVIINTSGAVSIENINFKVPTETPIDSIHISNVSELYVNNCSFNGSGLFLNGGLRGIQSDDSQSKVTVASSTFSDGYYIAIQGYFNELNIDNANISNCKSGINFQGGNNLSVKNTNISVVAKGNTNDTYAVRFASPNANTGNKMTLNGGTYSVDRGTFTADPGTYHSAIIVRSGASGELKANNLSLGGEVVNLSGTKLDATNNWWGDASGPKDVVSGDNSILDTNPNGIGSAAIGAVKYSPWHKDAGMTILTSPNAITQNATNLNFYDATLNGTNGSYDATGHSFWVSTSTFATTSSSIPAGVYSTNDFGSINANTDFSVHLSSLTNDAIITGGVHSSMPTIKPNTTYYYVAWSYVGNKWYPGEMKSFTTNPIPVPTLTSPIDGVYRHTSDSNKSDWSDVIGPTVPVTYYYESSLSTAVNGDGSFVSTAYTSGALTDSEIANPGEPEVTYYWHVKACDSVGNCSAWSGPWKIHIDNTMPIVPTMVFTANGINVTTNGYTNAKNFTFTLSSSSDTTRYQLKYWNDIAGSRYNENSPWNPIDLSGYSTGLGVYNDKFTQGEGTHYFAFSACDIAGNCSDYSSPFVVTYDKTAPVITSFSIPATSTSLTISITSFVATDTVGVIGYLLSETSTPPLVNDSNWVDTPPNSYTFGSEGTKTLYAWAKDAAGNISDSSNASVTITLPSPTPTTTNVPRITGTIIGGQYAFPTGIVAGASTEATTTTATIPGKIAGATTEQTTTTILPSEGQGVGEVLGEATTTLTTTTETTSPETTLLEGTPIETTTTQGTASITWIWYVIGLALLGGGVYLALTKKKV